ncbi:hypothetical protein HRI_002409400 [Hibiscus trionum]|uniref:Uncharacterized protein n=1 Tax=Hibiscus trionum TaxID=183268 RepID=A0A9W7I2J5_HIBTR|nr:hypothetical protein HRI_002409400 [Hibiscus trionum]
MKRGPWTAEEDQKLSAYIQQHGHGSWSSFPEKAGLKRCGKNCRLRWINYLRPDIDVIKAWQGMVTGKIQITIN